MFLILFSIKSNMWLMHLFFWLGQKKFYHQVQREMASATIKIILLYNKTNNCLSNHV